ncbi:replication-relaxation family protein [Thermogemmatispora sp.]|uniref:replication-relaxation family protein n=1 Tax=Thermogemmatispora sp. TaxID=1968838 RepID=UPI0035E3F839
MILAHWLRSTATPERNCSSVCRAWLTGASASSSCEVLRRAPTQLTARLPAPLQISAAHGQVRWLWTWLRDYRSAFLLGQQRWPLQATALFWLGVQDLSVGAEGRRDTTTEEQQASSLCSVHLPLLLDPGLPLADEVQRLCQQVIGWLALQAHAQREPCPRVGPVLLLLPTGSGPAAPPRRLQLWRQAAERACQQLGLSGLAEQQAPLILAACIPPGPRLAWHSLTWHALWAERPCSFWPLSQRHTRWFVASLNPSPTQQAHLPELASLSTRLGARHLQVLRHVFTLPLATTDELASVFAQPARTQATLAHLLAELRRLGCVRPIEPPAPRPQPRGGSPHWRLTERGLQLLAAVTGLPLSALASRSDAWPGEQWGQRAVRGLWRQWEHTQQLHRLLLQLIQAAQQRAIWWDLAPHTRHEDDRLTVIPDLLFAYRDAQRNVLAWIEVDRGTLKLPQYHAKWHRYLALSQRQARRLSLYLVCPDGAQSRMSHVIQQATAHQPAEYLVVRLAEWEQVQRAGTSVLHAPLWRQILPPPGRGQVAFLDP